MVARDYPLSPWVRGDPASVESRWRILCRHTGAIIARVTPNPEGSAEWNHHVAELVASAPLLFDMCIESLQTGLLDHETATRLRHVINQAAGKDLGL